MANIPSPSTVGQEIGGFLGGILNPIIGQTQTVETITPSANSKRTGTIVVAVVVVVIVVIAGYLLFKNKATS